ncbi:hypothetical protein LCGC14_0959570 [marine sediment metagenome]|uniref:Uncharacterized protein n=1 Tax=marine sediment metagenome TaxID=412755 RepID=A0A0F9RLB1_9ZZZZ
MKYIKDEWKFSQLKINSEIYTGDDVVQIEPPNADHVAWSVMLEDGSEIITSGNVTFKITPLQVSEIEEPLLILDEDSDL